MGFVRIAITYFNFWISIFWIRRSSTCSIQYWKLSMVCLRTGNIPSYRPIFGLVDILYKLRNLGVVDTP